jgi:hypothetical protein
VWTPKRLSLEPGYAGAKSKGCYGLAARIRGFVPGCSLLARKSCILVQHGVKFVSHEHGKTISNNPNSALLVIGLRQALGRTCSRCFSSSITQREYRRPNSPRSQSAGFHASPGARTVLLLEALSAHRQAESTWLTTAENQAGQWQSKHKSSSRESMTARTWYVRVREGRAVSHRKGKIHSSVLAASQTSNHFRSPTTPDFWQVCDRSR